MWPVISMTMLKNTNNIQIRHPSGGKVKEQISDGGSFSPVSEALGKPSSVRDPFHLIIPHLKIVSRDWLT